MRAAVVPFVVAVCTAAACNSVEVAPILDDAGAGPPDAGEDADAAALNATDAGTIDAADADAAPSFARAKGNPCRGIPLPPDQRYVPPGMCAHVVATRVGPIRSITFAPNGDLFGVAASGQILRFRDEDDDGFFEQPAEVSTYADTGGNGSNCHIDAAAGWLYAGSPDGVKRWPYAPGTTTGGPGMDVVVGQPSDGGHPKHTVHVYDGWLYVSSGSDANTSNPKDPEYDDNRALVRRFPLASFTPGQPFAWLSGEIVTRGLRNATGFTRNAAGRMFAVVSGIDALSYEGQDVHDDNPGEQIVEIAMGREYGFPFCFTAQRIVLPGGQLVAPGTQLHVGSDATHTDAWCAVHSSRPATFIQAHSTPLDLTFFDVQPTGGLPERFRGGAFVALHGSWNRSTPTGYKVVFVPFDAVGQAPMPTSTAASTTFPYEVVLGGGTSAGPQDGAWSWMVATFADSPRFVGVAISPIDGALYASSDEQGMIYRVGTPN